MSSPIHRWIDADPALQGPLLTRYAGRTASATWLRVLDGGIPSAITHGRGGRSWAPPSWAAITRVAVTTAPPARVRATLARASPVSTDTDDLERAEHIDGAPVRGR